MSSEVKVSSIPSCDLCREGGVPTRAAYDAKTVMGPWAYLCENHFRDVGPGRLGTGYGQRLVLR